MSKTDQKPVQEMQNLKTNSKTEAGDGPKPTTNSSEPINKLNELDLNDLVVEAKNLTFSYVPRKGNLLTNITMTFPRSAIYGLLGPSGCGKTTMIKLMIGRLTPISGKIKVNDKPVSDPSNKIPGSGVGYMPQDYALYNEFTLKETLKYFAKIYGLSAEYTKKRIEFLMKFLDLPNPDLLNGILSGGQKRRTSLAIALIHNPPLLILDEPTVGVDPMLRERIWKHLVQLSSQEKTSILITTHYIEECRRAHVIALMRGGHLLVENSPTELLTYFKTNDLDNVFLQVCKFEEKADRPTLPPLLDEVRKKNNKTVSNVTKKVWSNASLSSSLCQRFSALVIKNAIRLWRQKIFCLVSILLPIFGIILVCLTIGKPPFDLEIAVSNQEELQSQLPKNNMASLLFLNKINKKTLKLISYKSDSEAINSVRSGLTFGALIISKDFTSALGQRAQSMGMNVTDQVISDSTIHFHADMTDLMIHSAIFKTLMETEMKFKVEMLNQKAKGADNQTNGTPVNPRAIDPIIKLTDPPIYGSLDPKFINFATPGMLLMMVYLLSSAVTTLDVVTDRREGTLDRTLVAGVKMIEILTALIFVRMFILTIQSISVMIIIFEIFDIENNGNFVLIFVLLMLHSIHGMAFGLLTSSLAKDETMSLILCVGSFMPFLVISGIIWPLEGMHFLLRYISLFTPQTLPVLSLRSIILKGWGLGYTVVWAGFGITIFYTIVFLLLSSCLSGSRQD